MRDKQLGWMHLTLAVLLLLLAAARRVNAQVSSVRISGWIDGYYAWNSNAPGNHESFFPGTGTTAKRGNEFALNIAAIDFLREARPIGFHLTLNAGNSTEVVHAGEPEGGAVGRDALRAIYQASVSYQTRVGRGLLIEGGIYPAHIGVEDYFSKDNWNYTRSWLGELSPYYSAGVKLAYPFSDQLSGQLHILNGWQLIGDNNDGKAVGTQLNWNTDRLTVSFNTFVGPELAGDDGSLR